MKYLCSTAILLVSCLVGCSQTAMQRGTQEAVSGPFYRTMVYACDGGSSWVARFENDSVWLRSANERHILPQAISASGARYADSLISFWIHGAQASLQRTPEPPRLCRYDSTGTAWEQAWARGVTLRATGAEIAAKGREDWTLEITTGKQTVFVSENGKQKVQFEDTVSAAASTSSRVYGSWRKLAVEWDRRPCREGSSGEPLDLTVKIEYAGKKYQGCGRATN